MCERGKSCAECDDVLTCNEADAEEVPRHSLTGGLQNGGMADHLIQEAICDAGVSLYDDWRHLPAYAVLAARRLVFDGANPKDVLAVFTGAREALMDGLAEHRGQTRTHTDQDAYLGRTDPRPAPAPPRFPAELPALHRLTVDTDGRHRYARICGQFICLAKNGEKWTRGFTDMGAPRRQCTMPEFQALYDGLAAALKEFSQ